MDCFAGPLLSVGVGSNSNMIESSLDAEKSRAGLWEDRRERDAGESLRATCAIQTYSVGPQSGALWAATNERGKLEYGSRPGLLDVRLGPIIEIIEVRYRKKRACCANPDQAVVL